MSASRSILEEGGLKQRWCSAGRFHTVVENGTCLKSRTKNNYISGGMILYISGRSFSTLHGTV